MNRVQLIGNLCAAPELRYSTNNTAVCKFRIAVSDGYGEKKQTSFIPVTVFGKAAESCDRYLSKGSKVAVIGKIQTGSYEKQDGTKVYTTDVIADSYGGVEFLSNGENASNDYSYGNATKTPQNQNQSVSRGNSDDTYGEQIEGFSALTDEECPF